MIEHPAALAARRDLTTLNLIIHRGADSLVSTQGARLPGTGRQDAAGVEGVTARIFDKATFHLARVAQPSRPLFGIQESNAGKVVIFGGGVPVALHGSVVGAVGASARTVEQDIPFVGAAIAALDPATQPSKVPPTRQATGRIARQAFSEG